MKVIRKLSLNNHSWIKGPPLVRLLKILNIDGLNARMVGGCVRDIILGRDVMDIDIACKLTPEDSIERLNNAGIKVVLTGLKHGTITAVLEKRAFEITTLRRDSQTYGRHAMVTFTDDWLEDARRRDFTINALYLDADGSLYDPCDGLKDLAARRVRFIGNADRRISEDGLRILRFFRFAAQIGQGMLDPVGLEACIGNRDLIDNLSGERLAQEMFKILQAGNLRPILKVMADNNILQKILPGHRELKELNDLVELENLLGRCDILARLACLCGNNSPHISRHLKLSNKQAKILNQYTNHDITIYPHMKETDIRKAIYRFGREVFIFALLQSWSASKFEGGKEILKYAESWAVPTMPVLGRDLMKAGYGTGPSMGRMLRNLETAWIESDFILSKNDLLNSVQ